MQAETSPLIHLDGVSLRRNGKIILSQIDWEVRQGQQWAIVGPNGSGKTVLMQVLRGKLPCSAGRVVYANPALPTQIEMVSFELHQQLIASEQENEFVRQFSSNGDRGTTPRQLLAEIHAQGGEALAEFERIMGIDSLLDTPLLALSNGEMRKVLIARAFQSAPQILILDEPFDGLDVRSRQNLAGVIKNLIHAGAQILLITHHLDEISDVITHLLNLDGGKVLLCGEKDQVLRDARFPSPPNTSDLPIKGTAPAAQTLQKVVTNEPTVVMKDVTIAYDSKVILDRLNWVARRDENWAIVGPNGAGKTTLLRLISADHVQAYANEIYLFGRQRGSGESIWEIKQKMGVLSPELQIRYRENLSVLDVVLSGFFDSIGLYRRTTAEQGAAARAWLQTLGIANLADCSLNQLSYGQKRVALLARALVKSPEMLLLDEPTQGLDTENRQRLNAAISVVAEATGVQVLYVTHRRNEFPACITHVLEFTQSEGDTASEPRYRANPYCIRVE